jgi:formate dehydrogenase subunit delta
MMSNAERLVYMTAQILRNFAPRGKDGAIAAAAEHLSLFWDPRMKAQAIAMLDDPQVPLSDDVRATFSRLQAVVN